MLTETRMYGLELFDKIFKVIICDGAFRDPAAYDIAAAVQDTYLKEINKRCQPKSTCSPQPKDT